MLETAVVLCLFAGGNVTLCPVGGKLLTFSLCPVGYKYYFTWCVENNIVFHESQPFGFSAQRNMWL